MKGHLFRTIAGTNINSGRSITNLGVVVGVGVGVMVIAMVMVLMMAITIVMIMVGDVEHRDNGHNVMM